MVKAKSACLISLCIFWNTVHAALVACFKRILPLGIVLCLLLTVQDLRGSDWPMYRADAARSGYTSEPLPARLKIGWVRKADHAPRPASDDIPGW